MKRILFFTTMLFSITISAQHGYRDGNRIGISGGITQTSLSTSNFNVKPESGWIAGLSVRGNYYNDFSMIFGMQFTESNFSVETTTPLLQNKNVKYKLTAAQIKLLLSYNIVENYVALDFGPILQINDKLKINKDDENNIVSGTLLTANDIVDVTKINGNLYVGISAGSKVIKVVIGYQYGLNNFLNNLNGDDELKLRNNNHDFKGHLGIISGQLLISL